MTDTNRERMWKTLAGCLVVLVACAPLQPGIVLDFSDTTGAEAILLDGDMYVRELLKRERSPYWLSAQVWLLGAQFVADLAVVIAAVGCLSHRRRRLATLVGCGAAAHLLVGLRPYLSYRSIQALDLLRFVPLLFGALIATVWCCASSERLRRWLNRGARILAAIVLLLASIPNPERTDYYAFVPWGARVVALAFAAHVLALGLLPSSSYGQSASTQPDL